MADSDHEPDSRFLCGSVASSSAPTPPTGRWVFFPGWDERWFFDATVGQDRDPVLDDLRHVPVNFHPGEAFTKDAAVCQSSLDANTGAEIPQTTLQTLNLAKALDIATGER